MQIAKHIPERMCICCRQLRPKNELIRIVKTADGISVDETFKINGRGLYVCCTSECIGHLLKNKKFAQKQGFELTEEIKLQVEKLIER